MDTEKPPIKQRRDSSSGLAEDWSMYCAAVYDESRLHKRRHTMDSTLIGFSDKYFCFVFEKI